MRTRRFCYAVLASLALGSGASGFEDVLIDNTDLAPSDIVGAWTPANGANRFGTDLLHDGNAGKGTKSLSYRATLTDGGWYKVYLWHNGSGTAANAVPIDIHHADGTTTVENNQRENIGTWDQLGTFRFNANAEAKVVVRNNASGQVYSDAVRFEQVGAGPALDSEAGSNVTFHGSWSVFTDKAGLGGSYNRSINNNNEKWARFKPNIPVGGDYEVSVWFPAAVAGDSDHDIAPNLDIVVVDVNATHSLQAFPTQTGRRGIHNEGGWRSLGTYRFGAGNAGSVTIHNKVNGSLVPAGKIVVADVVRVDLVNVEEIIADNADTSWVTTSGAAWTLNTNASVSDRFGASHLSSGANASPVRHAHFQPTGSWVSGNYAIWAWWPAKPGFADNTRIFINGTLQSDRLNQTIRGGRWNFVTSGYFATAPEVRISNLAASPASIADAVMLTRDLDTDGDLIHDEWELRFFPNLTTLGGFVSGVAKDYDGDGRSDLQEFLDNTDPKKMAPQLGVVSPAGALLQ